MSAYTTASEMMARLMDDRVEWDELPVWDAVADLVSLSESPAAPHLFRALELLQLAAGGAWVDEKDLRACLDEILVGASSCATG